MWGYKVGERVYIWCQESTAHRSNRRKRGCKGGFTLVGGVKPVMVLVRGCIKYER